MRRGIGWLLVLCMVAAAWGAAPAARADTKDLAVALRVQVQKEEALRTFERMESFWTSWGVEVTPFDREAVTSPAADTGMRSVHVVTPVDTALARDPEGEAPWSASYEPIPGVFCNAYYYAEGDRPAYVFGIRYKNTLTEEEFGVFTRMLVALEPALTENASGELMSELTWAGGLVDEDNGRRFFSTVDYGGWRLTVATDQDSPEGFLYGAMPIEAGLEPDNTSIVRQTAVLNRMADVLDWLGYPRGDLRDVRHNNEDPSLYRLEREILPEVLLAELYSGTTFTGYSLEIPPRAQLNYDHKEIFLGMLYALNPFFTDEVLEEIYQEMESSMTNQGDGSHLSEGSWIDERVHFLQEHDGCKHLLMFSFFPADP